MADGTHHQPTPKPWRLVLSGGATGGAFWMAGALEALAATRLDLASADLIVGTSAGALMGSVIALGGRPWDLASKVGSTGGGGLADASVRQAALKRPAEFLRHRLMPSMGVRLSAAIGSLIPVGSHSTEHVEALGRDFITPEVVPHRGLRISTVERLSARRVLFGPELERLPKAVAASCAYRGGSCPSRSTAPPRRRDAGWLAMGWRGRSCAACSAVRSNARPGSRPTSWSSSLVRTRCWRWDSTSWTTPAEPRSASLAWTVLNGGLPTVHG